MSNDGDKKTFSVLENCLFCQEKRDDYTSKLLSLNQLPLVLTNKDLKEQLQISDSTLNRLIKLGDFPNCWFGIRGHYLRDDILEWVKKGKEDDFRDQLRLLRSL
ncbi:hypothetical protein IGJ01_000958 [Enterococcus sp. AZ089]|uniref:helix-turn-helix transcriptional regulator n=1 Tax=Enterococcus sp. AZ089 TaxID=2774693 RepID=UPI003D2FFF47